MISREDVVHIAKLARLELSEAEIEKMQKDLSSILGYMDVLKKAPKVKKVVKVDVPSHVRKDEVNQKDSSLAGDLVSLAPDQKDGYVKVKQVLS